VKVLVIAHTCRPVGGSEPGAAWNWALHLSVHHDVWLLCHPQYAVETDAALSDKGFPFRVEYIELPRFDPWKPERGEGGLKLHYVCWLQFALRHARSLHRRVKFDVVHHVGLGTITAPSPFWRLGIPAVWGPLGGGQVAPATFRSRFGLGSSKEYLRMLRVRTIRYRSSFQKAAARYDLCLATNRETLTELARAGSRNVRLFLDSGILTNVASAPVFRPRGDRTVLIWAGRLERHKALPVALEALRHVQAPVELRVAGGGPLRNEWMLLTRELGLSQTVKFLGELSSEEMRKAFRDADAFLFTSLRDSFGSVVLEAMSESLPVISLDHQGVGTFLPRSAAMLVPVTTPEETIPALGTAIQTFALMGPERNALRAAAFDWASAHGWPNRAKAMSSLYREVIDAPGLVSVPAPPLPASEAIRSKHC
jgi:glycosyltransferase involved in cell wall biosynthesis